MSSLPATSTLAGQDIGDTAFSGLPEVEAWFPTDARSMPTETLPTTGTYFGDINWGAITEEYGYLSRRINASSHMKLAGQPNFIPSQSLTVPMASHSIKMVYNLRDTCHGPTTPG